MSVHVTAPMLAAFNHFISVGFTENGAGSAVGNFCQESGEFLIATMFRKHPDASGGVPDALKSGGIAEWLGDRKTAYIAFASRAEVRLGLAKQSLLNDLGTQCDFVVYELQTTPEYATLYQQLTSGSRSVANLTANFMMVYERPKLGPTAGLDNRIAHAEAVVARARELKAAKVPQMPQVPPTVAIPQATATIVPPPPTPVPTAPTVTAMPISAATAGRQAAILDNLGAMRDAYLAEIAAAQNELAVIETTIADFGKLQGVSILMPTPLLQKPIAANTVATTTPQRTNTMFGILNWKTTLSGLIAAAAGVAKVFPQAQPYSDLLTEIGLVASGLAGIAAKDANVTGGTVPATIEAAARSASPPIAK